ncbi:EAL domain-containing protein [Duganella sp. FT92W]|uniref:EAL domain-containing protein n=1 Tax=Pseudoduganella rivuli TaxID=2666085 RepID=A0A7X2IR33_9BURK|nr:EAL domain-containing protein [Pseudoduganella rivuli]MRV74227.1 EAL domain-containing protein [Pseudoduganella rivuli]
MNAVPPHPESVAFALQLAGLPACACDAEGRIVAASEELDALLAQPQAGRMLADLWARHVQADSQAQLTQALALGAPRQWESCLARSDGQYVAVQARLKPLPAGVLPGGAMLVFHDIGVFQRDQRALRKALLEQQAILENAAVGIIFGKAGAILECNIRAAEMFGYARHELEGENGNILYPSEEARIELIEASRPLMEQGVSFRTETQLRRNGGELFWARVYGRALDPSDMTEGTVWIIEDITEQKEAEESMQQLVLEQRAILDNASVGILFTKQRCMLTCNPRFADMFGYTREEMYGRPAVELFVSPEVYVKFGAEAGPVLGAGLPFEKKEMQFRHKDGSLIWCRVRAQAVSQVKDGGTIWIMEDITKSRQTQMEVEAIMTNASISILFTKNRIITRYNRGFADMFRYDGDEGLGMPGHSLYPSMEAYEELGAAAGPLLAHGKPFQTEVEMRRKDDTTFWAQLIAYVVNPDDPSQGTIWIVEDRTEHKLAEESLRNALLENEAILDSAVLGISVCENGYNLRCNRKMEELFGYGPGDMANLSVQAFYADLSSWDAARQETARDFEAGRVNKSEHLLVRKDGSRFWARLSGRPFDLSQPKGRSVWLVDDITERREADEALIRARDELEVRVLERTAELAGANALLQGEIVERRQAEARVHHMAYHDSLTGLPNRALLADRLDRAMLAAQRSDRRLAVMFLDLDRFKTINDSLGHLTGDQLLKEVASRLCRAVRASDTVARLGGDEFVVLVPGIRSTDEAARVAEKIIESLAAPFPLEGRLLHITPSIGICIYPDDGTDVETLMRHADGAMYHAKASGRNNYQFFTQKMNLAAAQHFELESSLRSALALGQFELHFQPIIDIATRRVHTMEVLLRWRRPAQGLVMPDSFIPLIEENGLIVPIGEWVMRRACEQSMEWQRMGLEPVPLAVNLSPRQFMHRGLVDSIRRILDETGIDPSMIEFEITETALMQHGEHTMEILGQINAMGIRLSIDDFGTGYSSLAYLKRFPVKKIKIDRAFIKDLEESAEDRAIVAAIIALSDSLQLSVVAEGVETEGQFALLQGQGCQYAQGYLFSQPVPRQNAVHLLERRAAA